MTRIARTRPPRAWPLAALVASFLAGVFVDGYLRTYGPPQPAEPLVEAVRLKPDTTTAAVGLKPDTTTAAVRLKPDTTTAAVGLKPDTTTDKVASGFSRTDGPAMSAAPISPPPTANAPAPSARVLAPVATSGDVARGPLRVPIDGSNVEMWKGGFDERRGGGRRGHEAVDILSPRNTPVHAVENGTIAKIFESKAGGHTVYQFNPDGTRIYYYAHLERYENGLHEGQPILQGEVVGYVGTSGNAPPNTPHLHFAIFQLGADKRWWLGTAIDPYSVFKKPM